MLPRIQDYCDDGLLLSVHVRDELVWDPLAVAVPVLAVLDGTPAQSAISELKPAK
jgi:hypothetical protein